MGHVCNIEQSDARCWVYFLADLVSRRPEGRPMQSVLDDPKLWHDCAADACVTAEQMIDPDSKRLMLGIADGYRQLSRRSEERRSKGLPKNSGSDPADRPHAEAHGAKILFHPSFAKRGGQPHDQDGAKTS